MKKRVMKKYIPKGIYCYDENGTCKWMKRIGYRKIHRINCEFANECEEKCWESYDTQCQLFVYRCEYLKYTDFEEESLLWDFCKECNVKRDWNYNKQRKLRKWQIKK